MDQTTTYQGRRDCPPIPPAVYASLRRYVDEKIATGDFLRAVIENDMAEAIGRADPQSLAALPNIVLFLYNEAPAPCWGSKLRRLQWLNDQAALEKRRADVIAKRWRYIAVDCPVSDDEVLAFAAGLDR